MTYTIRNPQIEALLKELGRMVKGLCPPGWGFNIMLFSFGENGDMFYLSSANRKDMIKAMQEFIDKNKE